MVLVGSIMSDLRNITIDELDAIGRAFGMQVIRTPYYGDNNEIAGDMITYNDVDVIFWFDANGKLKNITDY